MTTDLLGGGAGLVATAFGGAGLVLSLAASAMSARGMSAALLSEDSPIETTHSPVRLTQLLTESGHMIGMPGPKTQTFD